MRSAATSAAASTITPGARPRTTRRSTDQSRPLKGAANRASVASASRRTASSASASPAPPDVSGSPNQATGMSYAVSIVTDDPPGIDSDATRSRAWIDDGEPSIARRIRTVASMDRSLQMIFPAGTQRGRAVGHLLGVQPARVQPGLLAADAGRGRPGSSIDLGAQVVALRQAASNRPATSAKSACPRRTSDRAIGSCGSSAVASPTRP